jgi:hypothetical protein
MNFQQVIPWTFQFSVRFSVNHPSHNVRMIPFSQGKHIQPTTSKKAMKNPSIFMAYAIFRCFCLFSAFFFPPKGPPGSPVLPAEPPRGSSVRSSPPKHICSTLNSAASQDCCSSFWRYWDDQKGEGGAKMVTVGWCQCDD